MRVVECGHSRNFPNIFAGTVEGRGEEFISDVFDSILRRVLEETVIGVIERMPFKYLGDGQSAVQRRSLKFAWFSPMSAR